MSIVSPDAASANPDTLGFAKEKPRLRRSEVPAYLMERHGYPIALASLHKAASVGGGPPMVYAGRIPLYPVDLLDAWVEAKLSKPVSSTAERSVF
jgi:hypothetical protein